MKIFQKIEIENELFINHLGQLPLDFSEALIFSQNALSSLFKTLGQRGVRTAESFETTKLQPVSSWLCDHKSHKEWIFLSVDKSSS